MEPGAAVASQADISNGIKVASDTTSPTTLHIQTADSTEGLTVSAVKHIVQDFKDREKKIHRFPATMRGLGRQFIDPMVVSIGPYHHGLENLKAMEEVKLVATSEFVGTSEHSREEIYEAVLSITADARRLYDPVAGMTEQAFATMMFHDGCFLLQYMLMYIEPQKVPKEVGHLYFSNGVCIDNDIMLLENQLPWLVIETLMRFTRAPIPVGVFIATMGDSFQSRLHLARTTFDALLDLDESKRPHILGLLRAHKTGNRDVELGGMSSSDRPDYIPSTVSAIELADIGINLATGKTTELTDMGIKRGTFSADIFLPPLFLDRVRASWLVNMAALEICTAENLRQEDRETTVCAYISVVAMLMDREDDAHELRKKRVVQGQHTDKETLDFFKTLAQHLPDGMPLYDHILAEIAYYKHSKSRIIKGRKFCYSHFKTILTVVPVFVLLVAILNVLLSKMKS